jgi:hypothetical protein
METNAKSATGLHGRMLVLGSALIVLIPLLAGLL